MVPSVEVGKFSRALPFFVSLALVPLVGLGAIFGGWMLILPLVYGHVTTTILDALGGLSLDDNDPETGEDKLFWYKLITLIWFPLQALMVFGCLWVVSRTDHLGSTEKILLMLNAGFVSAVGIVFAHELIHRSSKFERRLGDGILALVLYSHFRSEHLLVHHRYVGTPRDPITPRYNEHFYRYLPRILVQCFRSALRVEAVMLKRKGLGAWSLENPFYQYIAAQLAFLMVAGLIGGWIGVGYFALQAALAILYLEMVEYVEHYGLTRKHLGNGKYEHVLPRHSWNSAHRVSNWLLINLQRHSDHHYKPSRRFPLLQNYSQEEAPQLPFGYPAMTTLALIPPLWLRLMNPKVRKWRAMYYPEITDWTPYKNGTLPMPVGAS